MKMKIESSQRTLRGQAYQLLRDELLSGRLEPGQRVNEVQIAGRMGISRGTLREAIRKFEQEGLMVTVPHRGTYVRRFSVREAEELQEVRLALETTAALRVARAWNEPVRGLLETRLEALRTACEDAHSFPERVAADLAFHEGILECCGNRTLLAVWRSLIGNISVMVLNVGPERMAVLQDPGEHARLLEAIASGDEARIRREFADVFAEGQRVVAEAVGDRDAADLNGDRSEA
jgi:DNA-binding GntR family transcriptional regulator